MARKQGRDEGRGGARSISFRFFCDCLLMRKFFPVFERNDSIFSPSPHARHTRPRGRLDGHARFDRARASRDTSIESSPRGPRACQSCVWRLSASESSRHGGHPAGRDARAGEPQRPAEARGCEEAHEEREEGRVADPEQRRQGVPRGGLQGVRRGRTGTMVRAREPTPLGKIARFATRVNWLTSPPFVRSFPPLPRATSTRARRRSPRFFRSWPGARCRQRRR